MDPFNTRFYDSNGVTTLVSARSPKKTIPVSEQESENRIKLKTRERRDECALGGPESAIAVDEVLIRLPSSVLHSTPTCSTILRISNQANPLGRRCADEENV